MNKILSDEIYEFVNVEIACKILNVSKSWLYKATSSRRLKHYKIGGKILFNINELNDYLLSQRVEAVIMPQ
jgi:excisionase family DNA binding protein